MKRTVAKPPYQGDRYKYREGQKSLHVFVDKRDLENFTVLCIRLGTDKTQAIRAYLSACVKAGKL